MNNLLPKTKYAIKVQAISDRGPGVISDPYIIKTLPSPPKAPKNFEVGVHDNNTIAIKFNPSTDPENLDKIIKVSCLIITKNIFNFLGLQNFIFCS